MGDEAASTLIGTVVRGVFAGDAKRLSLDASFPIMRDMERKHRSLVLAMIKGKRSPGGRTIWSFRGGIESMVRALAAECLVLALAAGIAGIALGWVTLRILVQGLQRIRIERPVSDDPYLVAEVVEVPVRTAVTMA